MLKPELSDCGKIAQHDVIPWVSLDSSFPPYLFAHWFLCSGLANFEFPGVLLASKQYKGCLNSSLKDSCETHF